MNSFTTSFLANNLYNQSVEDNWVLFRDTLLNIVENYISHKLFNPHKHLPWLSKNIKLQMKKRKKLYDQLEVHTQSIKDWQAYKKARNKVIKSLSTTHQNYYTYLFDNSYTDNQKRFWPLAERLRKNYKPVATLYADEDLKTTPVSKGDALYQQFYSVFTMEDNNTPIISSPQFPNIPDVIFTTNGIQKLLEDLKPGKAVELDSIPT